MKRKGLLFVALILILASATFVSCPPSPGGGTAPDNGEEENDPPVAPHTPYPLESSTDQSIRPVFSWQCEDPESDPLTFTIYLTRFYDDYQHDPIVSTKNLYEMTEDLEKNRRYDWYVYADDLNNTWVRSETWTFYTGESSNNPPYIPWNPDPPDYATDVQAEDVTLSWDCFDPDGDPMVYDVWLEVHSTGTGDFLVQNHPDDYYNVGAMGRGVDFRWYVVAKDDQGGSASNHATPWRFETEEVNNPPERPHTPVPAHDATGVPLDQMLSWQCSDPDGDRVTYDVWFGPPLMPVLVSTGKPETFFMVEGMLRGHEYEWWVVARDDEGAETQSYFWSFTTTNDVYAELEVLRTLYYDYGMLTIDDMIKARFDGAYAPDAGIEPLQPSAVTCNSYDLTWLTIEKIYFYRDPQNDPFLVLNEIYTFDVTAGGGVDEDLNTWAVMPLCEAYFNSPANNTNISLIDGFEVQWISSCPGTGTVDIYVRNDLGEDVGIHVNTDNDGSYTFIAGELTAVSGSFQIFVDIIAVNQSSINAIGYSPNGFRRGRTANTLMLYAM